MENQVGHIELPDLLRLRYAATVDGDARDVDGDRVELVPYNAQK